MNVLGLSFFYHDSAAALVKDGVLVAAAEEERFSRVKHDSGFPQLAIEFALKDRGITMDDVDYVRFLRKALRQIRTHAADRHGDFPQVVGRLP